MSQFVKEKLEYINIFFISYSNNILNNCHMAMVTIYIPEVFISGTCFAASLHFITFLFSASLPTEFSANGTGFPENFLKISSCFSLISPGFS